MKPLYWEYFISLHHKESSQYLGTIINKKEMAEKALELLGPGSLLRKELKQRGLTQRKFAEEVGMRPSHISEIISGKRSVSQAIAIKFQEALGVEAKVWLELQLEKKANERIDDKELKAAEQLTKLDYILSLSDLFKSGKVDKKSPCSVKLAFLKDKIGIDSVEGAKASVNGLIADGFFRKSEKTGLDARMIATWVALAKMEAHNRTISNKFDRSTLPAISTELSSIFHENKNTIYQLMNTFEKYGIKFCIVDKVKHASVDGYSFLDNDVPTIVITKRFDRIDNLAFSVMHEVCHVYKHLDSNGDQRLNVVCEDFDNSKEEKEANEFAANALIPEEKWKHIPSVPLTKPWVIQSIYSKWAKANGLNKWIVLGRVSHETGMYKFRTDSSRTIN